MRTLRLPPAGRPPGTPEATFKGREVQTEIPSGSLLDGQGLIGRISRQARVLLFYRRLGKGYREHLEIGRNFPREAGFINITALKEQESIDCGAFSVKALPIPANGSPAKGVIGIEFKFPSSPGHSMELFIDGERGLMEELGEHLLTDPWMPLAILGNIFPENLKVLFDENPMERYSRSMLLGTLAANSAGHLLVRTEERMAVFETHVGSSAPEQALSSIPPEDAIIPRPEGSGVIKKALMRQMPGFSVLSFSLDYQNGCGAGAATATLVISNETAQSIAPLINAVPDFMLDIFKGIFPRASGTLKPSVSEDFHLETDIRRS